MLLPCPLGFLETPVTAIRLLAKNSDAASRISMSRSSSLLLPLEPAGSIRLTV